MTFIFPLNLENYIYDGATRYLRKGENNDQISRREMSYLIKSFLCDFFLRFVLAENTITFWSRRDSYRVVTDRKTEIWGSVPVLVVKMVFLGKWMGFFNYNTTTDFFRIPENPILDTRSVTWIGEMKRLFRGQVLYTPRKEGVHA